MNQQLINGLTATLLITALGTATSTYAEQPQAIEQSSESNVSNTGFKTSSTVETVNQTQQASSTLPAIFSTTQVEEVVKVGSYKSITSGTITDTIAKVQSHQVSGRQAATLYVRNIPVLTFLSSATSSSNDKKLPTLESVTSIPNSVISTATGLKLPSATSEATAADGYQEDPVWRATTIAATLNQLNRDSIDANTIKVRWDGNRSRYQIKVDGKPLLEFDSATILPDSTRDPAADALQATNRLRRLLGNASPLQAIEGKPSPVQTAYRSLQSLTGWASWYGPGFNGAMSASGEIFNQNALTAAHKELPFGTRVRVTNLDNGRSVIVRINDRGPFTPGRVIDLSAGAANVIGLIHSGVAPVRLEVLTVQQAASLQN